MIRIYSDPYFSSFEDPKLYHPLTPRSAVPLWTFRLCQKCSGAAANFSSAFRTLLCAIFRLFRAFRYFWSFGGVVHCLKLFFRLSGSLALFPQQQAYPNRIGTSRSPNTLNLICRTSLRLAGSLFCFLKVRRAEITTQSVECQVLSGPPVRLGFRV